MMTDIAVFIRARLDEDQEIALATQQWSHSWQNFDDDCEVRDSRNAGTVAYTGTTPDRDHIARHDPARILRDVAAKRAILEAAEHWRLKDQDREGMDEYCRAHAAALEYDVLPQIAAIYSDHPDYSPEWAEE